MNSLHAGVDGAPFGRRGFTLIELLIASVLAALLIGGVVMAAGACATCGRVAASIPHRSLTQWRT